MEGFNSDITSNGNSLGQKWMFNSRELTESLELNNYEMDFRHYDAALGRFNSIDLFSELSYNFTPYRFGFNNPIVFNDPTGLFENRRQARRYRRQMKKKYKRKTRNSEEPSIKTKMDHGQFTEVMVANILKGQARFFFQKNRSRSQ
jgi:RHS repeat-associated protein